MGYEDERTKPIRHEDEINSEEAALEEDGAEYLEEMLRTDEEFRAVWEANRAKREFGHSVLRRRLDLGLSQRELANRVGTSQNRIYLIENGEANPTLDTLTRLADELGLGLEVHLTQKPDDPVDTVVVSTG